MHAPEASTLLREPPSKGTRGTKRNNKNRCSLRQHVPTIFTVLLSLSSTESLPCAWCIAENKSKLLPQETHAHPRERECLHRPLPYCLWTVHWQDRVPHLCTSPWCPARAPVKAFMSTMSPEAMHPVPSPLCLSLFSEGRVFPDCYLLSFIVPNQDTRSVEAITCLSTAEFPHWKIPAYQSQW